MKTYNIIPLVNYDKCYPTVVTTLCTSGYRILQFVELTLYQTIPTFKDPKKRPFENIVGKGENAGNQQFLLFTQCFRPILKTNSVFKLNVFCCLQMLSIWASLKICRLVKSFNSFPHDKIFDHTKLKAAMICRRQIKCSKSDDFCL